jgi:hypothetical protein
VNNLHEVFRTRQDSWRFPSSREIRAAALGADQLIDYVECGFRSRPGRLAALRTCHRKYCARLFREIEKSAHVSRQQQEAA